MGTRCSGLLAIGLLLVLVVASGGCVESDAQATASAGPRRIEDLRLVSLSPALSRTLVDFGLETRIVGRSAFCDFLDEDIPVAGDLHRTNYERLIELSPTHVLVQAAPDAKLIELAGAHNWQLGRWDAVDTIDDIEQTVRELSDLLLPPGAEDSAKLATRSAELLNEIAAALAPGANADRLWRGPTLLVYAVEPVGVFGRGTYLHNVLSRFGAENAATADRWAELSLEDVARLDPQAIIMVRPGAGDALDPLQAIGPIADLDIAAVRDVRVAVLAHEDALRPCTGIIGVAEEMRRVLRALGAPGGIDR
jgi:ABC-type Fe3+-hydroxamate transport system substrate-binding protein